MAKDKLITQREKEVLSHLLQGKSNQQIALALNISVRTVEFHLTNIYAKFHVSSRIELILHLVNATSRLNSFIPGVSTVAGQEKISDNGDKSQAVIAWVKHVFEYVSRFGKGPEMKKRWFYYLLIGLVFGAGYWHYFSLAARAINYFFVPSENTLILALSVLVSLLIDFGVWLLPGILPAVYELRQSSTLRQAVGAVVIVCISAVIGYYLNYMAMLALVGLPHMESLVILGERTAELGTLWAEWFPKLILNNMIKWVGIGLLLSSLAGLATGKIYMANARETSPA